MAQPGSLSSPAQLLELLDKRMGGGGDEQSMEVIAGAARGCSVARPLLTNLCAPGNNLNSPALLLHCRSCWSLCEQAVVVPRRRWVPIKSRCFLSLAL